MFGSAPALVSVEDAGCKPVSRRGRWKTIQRGHYSLQGPDRTKSDVPFEFPDRTKSDVPFEFPPTPSNQTSQTPTMLCIRSSAFHHVLAENRGSRQSQPHHPLPRPPFIPSPPLILGLTIFGFARKLSENAWARWAYFSSTDIARMESTTHRSVAEAIREAGAEPVVQQIVRAD